MYTWHVLDAIRFLEEDEKEGSQEISVRINWMTGHNYKSKEYNVVGNKDELGYVSSFKQLNRYFFVAVTCDGLCAVGL